MIKTKPSPSSKLCSSAHKSTTYLQNLKKCASLKQLYRATEAEAADRIQCGKAMEMLGA